jgi:FMN phosphatase YigB (HAD superfamily)
MSNLNAVFFDFDGVLCTDRFYTTLEPDYPQVINWINQHVFGGEKYADRWMRGEYTYRQINKIIADATGIPYPLLNERMLASIHLMKVNPVVLQFAEDLKKKSIKTAIVTGNMDVFDEITVPEKKLDKIFPVIVNSWDFKLMKQDENGILFDIALQRLGLYSYKGVTLVDDSLAYCDMFKEKGGDYYHYTDQEAFEKWAKELLSF